MIKQFKDLNDGDVFKFKDLKLREIPTVKLTCCRSINAEDLVETNKKTFIPPESEVEVDDQL